MPVLITPIQAAWATADQVTDASEAEFFDSIPTVLSATRLRQRATEAPASVTVIDRQLIQASGALDIADLFRLVPGFQVVHASGTQHAATYHGQADQYPTRLQVLIDGRSVYTPILSSVDWVTIGVDLEDIDRIEVIRGPNTSTYGANAVMGAINIITRQPFQDRGTTAQLAAGSRDTRRGMLRHAGSLGAMDYRATLSYREDDGFDTLDDDPAPYNVETDNKRIGLANFRGTYNLRPDTELEVALGYVGGPEGAGPQMVVDKEHDKHITGHHQFLKWSRRDAAHDEFQVQFYHNYFKTHDQFRASLSDILSDLNDTTVPPDFVPLLLSGIPDQDVTVGTYHATTERYDLEAQRVQGWRSQRLVWGGGVRLDRFGSTVHLDSTSTIEDESARLFANLESGLSESVIVNSGVMLEHSDMAGTKLSPRLGLNWLLHPDRAVRLSAARAYRMPSLLEENWRAAVRLDDGTLIKMLRDSPGGLKPEQVTSYEIGYIDSTTPVDLELKLYREQLRDGINGVLDKATDIFVYTNGEDFDTKGIEGVARWDYSQRGWVRLNYAWAMTEGNKLNRLSPVKYKELDIFTPRHTLGLLTGYKPNDDLEFSAALYRVSAVTWGGDGDPEPGWNRIDLRAAYRSHLPTGALLSELLVQNFADKHVEFRDEHVFGTRVYLRVTLQFN
jgi:iron complex outermembrane receptor protein